MSFDKGSLLGQTEYKAILEELEENQMFVQYLTLSGSYAYGTDTENSDIDIRGFFMVPIEHRLGLKEPCEAYESGTTDTVLYSFHKFCKLLTQVNPNAIEMLGTRKEDILLSTPLAESLRDHADLFLSKRVFSTFAGYATQQLRRLENALARDSYPQAEKERHIMRSFEAEMMAAQKNFSSFDLNSDIKLYLADSRKEDFNQEIYIDVSLKGIPLRDYLSVNHEMENMLRNYGKLSHRNHKKDEPHLYKHAMHLIRLYCTGIDILRNGIINTYRDKEHDLLMSIRNGEISFEKIFALQRKLESELKTANDESRLPDKPRYDEINDFVVKACMR